ncbi:MAG: HNH endonuclease [Deltaproteobacteria bacterium]|nr:HNH endonuclease [Deltaproteobacteria bacterium]
MRRSISEIVDPGLTRLEKDLLWKHFGASCAFCGEGIERASRTGHVDHLESGGGNGPRNRVLACARCNGDEKREREWREFLSEKCMNAEVLAARRALIETWVARHSARNRTMSAETEDALRDAERLVDDFHAACTRLRRAVKAGSE